MRQTFSGTTASLEYATKRRNALSGEGEGEKEREEDHLEDHLRALLLVFLFLLLSRGLLRLLLLPTKHAILQTERNERSQKRPRAGKTGRLGYESRISVHSISILVLNVRPPRSSSICPRRDLDVSSCFAVLKNRTQRFKKPSLRLD